MFYLRGGRAGGGAWVPGPCSTATEFATKSARLSAAVNAIAEPARRRWSGFRCSDVASRRPCKDGYRRPPTSGM